jgi:hypothetical protein
MKKTALVVFALVFVALPAIAGADTFFAYAGTLSKVECTVTPTVGGPGLLQCAIAILPDPGMTAEIDLYCLDPVVAKACSSFQTGDPVLIQGHENRIKMVDKIGYWVKGTTF